MAVPAGGNLPARSPRSSNDPDLIGRIRRAIARLPLAVFADRIGSLRIVGSMLWTTDADPNPRRRTDPLPSLLRLEVLLRKGAQVAPRAVGVERSLLHDIAGSGSATGSPGWSGPFTRWVGYRPLTMMNHDADPNGFDPELAELENLSNGALELIERGRFDEAERICLELKRRFPDQIDWIERSAALHLARGRVDRAIECYEECLVHIDRDPDGFDSDSRAWYRDEIARLRSRRAR